MPIPQCSLAFVFAVAALAWTAQADDQPPKHLPKVGLLSWSSCRSSELEGAGGEWTDFLRSLRELGYEPGISVEIDCRSADGNYTKLDSAAHELTRIPVDVIVSTSGPATDAGRRSTKSIPLVAIDVGLFGQAYAYSTNNFTGLVNNWLSLTGKRLEFLKEAAPGAKKIGVLSNPVGRYQSYEGRAKRAAQDLSLDLIFYRVRSPEAFESTFAQMKEQRVDAVLLLPDLLFSSEAARISELSIRYGFPTMAWDTRLIEDGFLLTYSSNSAEQEKRLAFYVDKTLKGAVPFQLPIEQPSDFTLSVNLRTARAIGLTLPRSIMFMAEKVVE